MSMDSLPAHRHSFTTDNGPPAKRFKGPPEVPAQYSDAVRKKLASTSRTGQACDRCKERKMKCDTNPTACLPCRQKNLRCLTTDRVTGKALERGQADRQESEIHELRRLVASYQQKYGGFEDKDLVEVYSGAEAYPNHVEAHKTPYKAEPFKPTSSNQDDHGAIHSGPINGTIVDLIGDEIDIGDFACPELENYDEDRYNVFNTSKTSVINTMCGRQSIDDPRLPDAEEGLKFVKHFLKFIWPYMPILHRPTFLELAKAYYADPNSVTVSERLTIVMVLAIITHQSAVRNPTTALEMMEKSNRLLHYVLSHYCHLFHDKSLAAMQAVTLVITHLRNLPKPGYSWVFSHKVLVRAIDLNYHRSPDKIPLPDAENNVLAKELRKRIFWSILGICVTIGTKQGKPAPWQFTHVDVPLPLAIRDTEISREGLMTSRSGKCDFWIALRLFKLLPLLTDLYNEVICVRRPRNEYLQAVDRLDASIIAWRKEWDDDISLEEHGKDENAPTADDIRVATLHVEIWAAEFQLILHHPKLDTSGDTETIDRNLDLCHSCSKKLFSAFKTLSQRHRGADFTWHTTVTYALAFGVVLHIYNDGKDRASSELFEAMGIELREWLVVMGLADTVMRTNSFLMRSFNPRVQRLETEYRRHLGLSLEANSQQVSPPTKAETPLQTKVEPTSQQNIYSDRSVVEQQSPATITSSYPPITYPYHPHPPMFPDSSYQLNPYSSSAPTTQYPQFTPTTGSHHVQYSQPVVPASLAPLLENSNPAFATYQTYSNNIEVWPDYTDERSFWPHSLHHSIHQGLGQ